jgi:nitroimidazol reductase NimA-like FMN-containing flavoprotein (pyridoxamine 5'-phosphate oxidase superfamily)
VGTADKRTGLEHLDEATCWALLENETVGRLGVTVGRQPDIFPVSYLVRDRSIVFRTAGGTKLAAAVLGGLVAFEIDAVDEDNRVGWSVVVHGSATEAETLDEVLEAELLPLEPWVDATKDRWVTITPTEVTGRRVPMRSARTG